MVTIDLPAKYPSRPESRGNNLDDVRRNNLSAVLRLVHTTGPIARAQLTRETGLNRSTVGALVGELLSLGLVSESLPDTARQVGRPSPVIVAGREAVALAIHPELDSVIIGLVALGGQVIKRIRYETTGVPAVAEVVNVVSAVVAGMRDELDTSFRTVGVGLAVPGLVRASDGTVNLAPHLGWHHEPLAQLLSDALHLPVFASNDAAAGAVAESLFGVGIGVRDMVYLNGGASGIGGGLVNDGALMTGASGYAGELGHTLVNSAGSLCHCGAKGCLETEVVRAPLLDALGLAASTQIDMLEQTLLARLADQPDRDLLDVIDRQIDFLAVALRNAVNFLNPQLIVLGGYLGVLLEVAPERLRAAVAGSAMTGPREAVQITRASLGSDLLIVGAAQLALEQVLANPSRFPRA